MLVNVFDDVAFEIDQELVKVPFDFFVSLVLEPIEEWMCVISVDVDFLQHRELYIIVVFCPLVDVRFFARLLLTELVAGECEDLQAKFPVKCEHFREIGVVHISHTSFCCNIDDKRGCCIS